MYERRVTPAFLFKLQFEGMYQYMGQIASDRHDSVYGLAGGGRFEIGPFRLGLSAFYGRGLGTYVALQNASSTFNGGSRNLRYFTGLYAQTAVVFGREQVSAGIGRVKDDLLPEDRTDLSTSNLKYQTGISGAFYHRLSENLVLGIDYFYFRTDWWGGAAFSIDPTTMAPVASGGLLPGEKQVVQLVNVGATFYW